MCLALPMKLESIEGQTASAALAQTKATVMVTLTPEAKVGDWVLVHAGYAIAVIDEHEAHETYAILREMDMLSAP
jgi:hydrogenase expression/formation protein HypC